MLKDLRSRNIVSEACPIVINIVANRRFIYFFVERQRSPSAHFVRRRGGTPCWVPFSLAVPGFTFPNRFRAVDGFSIEGRGRSIGRAVAIIS